MTKSVSLSGIRLLTQPQPTFLISTRGHSAPSVGVSFSFPSCESCWSLTLQTFGPWPASLRLGAVQRGRQSLRAQVEVITEILDALIGTVPVQMSPGKLFFHVAS